MPRTLPLALAAAVALLLAGCEPTYPDGELLPIFDGTPATEDALPAFVDVQSMRDGSNRYVGTDDDGIRYWAALADLMGNPVSTCLVSVSSEELWAAACSPTLPVSSSLEGYGEAILQATDAPEPDGSYVQLSDNLWVQVTD